MKPAWVFIALVTILDCWFAVEFKDTLLDWELNPVHRWLFWYFGVWACVSFRLTATYFGYSVIRDKVVPTLIILLVHVWLLSLYLRIYWGVVLDR